MKVTVISVPLDETFENHFRVRPKPKLFKVRRKKVPITQPWYTPVPAETIIGIKDLNPEQEYSFFKFHEKGGFRVVCASGGELQRSWRSCLKKDKIGRFIASFHPRMPSGCKLYNPPTNRWREVVLHPRRDLFFTVQPVAKKHYVNAGISNHVS